MKNEYPTLKLYIVGVILLFLLLVIAFIVNADEPMIRRAGRRVVPSGVDAECQFVTAPWGVPCRVGPEDCSMHFYPMFFSENRIVHFKLITDQSLGGGDELGIDFTDRSGYELSYEWDGTTPKWVEWYVRQEDGSYLEVPIKGCYCNEREGVVYVCINGEVQETVSKKGDGDAG